MPWRMPLRQRHTTYDNSTIEYRGRPRNIQDEMVASALALALALQVARPRRIEVNGDPARKA